jgi:hypothetical protein
MKFKTSMLMLGAAVSLGGLTAAVIPTHARAACTAQTSSACAGKTGTCTAKPAPCAAAKCKAN